MSSDPNSISEAIRILTQARPGLGADPRGVAGKNPRAADPKILAFQAEMRMAQQAMAVGEMSDESAPAGMSAGTMDSGLLSDSMLMDALTTIARLTGQGLPQARPAALAQPEKALTRNPSAQGLGSVAALFESGDKGSEAIGYDRTGGTSYGKFQISSRAGTMNRFLSFLDEHEPSLAARLRRAGPANTGSVRGRMPAEWAKIAAENPARFERLQHEFIKKDHYQPAREKILEQTGVDIDATKPALREALFSTAVQHGATGAARIFNQVIEKFLNKPEAAQVAVKGGKGFEQVLVSEVYNKRQNQFSGSTEAVRASVRGRLSQEKDMVLAMLKRNGMNRTV